MENHNENPMSNVQTLFHQKEIMQKFNLSRTAMYYFAERANLKKYKIGVKVFYDIIEIQQKIREGNAAL